MGDPIPQNRPRFTKKGKPYSDQGKEKTRWLEKAQPDIAEQNIIPTTLPVSLNIVFYFERPKSHYRGCRKANPLKDSAPMEMNATPDLSNLIKWVEDCLEGKCWANDKSVVSLRASKQYTKGKAFTLVEYQELY
jgi:Holliday junction resolvase RusA-like endonuclease